MKPLFFILLTMLCSVAFTGCGTLRQPATDVLLTGVGGAIGYEASGKKIGGAAIGAGAGYVASKLVNSQIDTAITEAEQRGYNRAMNQAVKQQYWIIQNQQQHDTAGEEPGARYVTVTLPETVTADGAILKPTTATIRTQ